MWQRPQLHRICRRNFFRSPFFNRQIAINKTYLFLAQSYWPTELEVACLAWVLQKIRHLILAISKPVVVYTDHSATVNIAVNTNLHSTATAFSGTTNKVTDALFRLRSEP
ncbi:unnamed protein product [Penicillium camemberti]|uniref:Str. FM013 n=1 Tax=Penicillium camemberti (strain FM 013) TaxID=1429867 RepID=A0A0G4PIP0_PENC3|nr:unnamed protein product [Penicillium camemberti]